MKRILRLGESYVLSEPKTGRLGYYAVKILILMFFMCAEARAQDPAPGSALAGNDLYGVKRLSVGDYLPESFWERDFLFFDHGDSVRANLSAHRGKLLLLDFWATWCANCIKGFPQLEKLQREYGDRLEIVLVNASHTLDDFEKINRESEKVFQSIRPRSIIEDEFLAALLFPRGPIPLYVWINPSGQIIAITFKEFVNREQVDVIVNQYNQTK